MKKIILILAAVLPLSAGCGPASPVVPPVSVLPAATSTSSQGSAATSTPASPSRQPALTEPIGNALSRVTKKPFGIYVAPQNSPVQPERFTGYHTGVDFETTPAEQNVDVDVYAACAGKLLLKEYASGYGGVAVQSCQLDGQPVTLIYGHLRLSSIKPGAGDQLTPGQQIAVLGAGYSSETDGERKHLHFGIHKGTAINILGYVQEKSELSGWLDPIQYLK